MKSIKNDGNTTGENVFPHIGYYGNTGNIVLFTSQGVGIYLYGGGDTIGRFSGGWNSNYELFTGSITLSND